ncbi:DUF4092 domain-containing protein [Vibrio rotiferianus]|uniref:DUF4092 domain-containing protein n=1 Tax=Vibrio rotiferianus TaxID=190895 RepID=UPI00406A6FD4
MKKTLIAASIALVLSGCGDDKINTTNPDAPVSSEQIAENLGPDVNVELVDSACNTEVSTCTVDDNGNVKISVTSSEVGSVSFEPQFNLLIQEKEMNLKGYRAEDGEITSVVFEPHELVDSVTYVINQNNGNPILIASIRLNEEKARELANANETVVLKYTASTGKTRKSFNGSSTIIDSSIEVFQSILSIVVSSDKKEDSERPPVDGEPELPPIDWTPIDPDAVNHAPTIESIAGQVVTVGESTQITVHAADKDQDTLTYSVSGAGFARFEDNILILEPTKQQTGNHTVTVTVSDGSLTALTQFEVNVVQEGTDILPPSNTAPTIEPLSPLSFEWGKGEPVEVVAHDAEGDKLTYKLATNDIATIDSKTGVIRFTTDEDDVRSHKLTVTVTDGSLSSTATLLVTVKKQNIDWTPIQPSITVIPEGWTFTQSALGFVTFYNELGNALKFTPYSDLVFKDSNGTLHDIVAIPSDEYAEKAREALEHNANQASMNSALVPVVKLLNDSILENLTSEDLPPAMINPVEDQNVKVGEKITVQVEVTNALAYPVKRYDLGSTLQDEFATINNDGLITINADGVQAGNYTYILTVINDSGKQVKDTFIIKVEEKDVVVPPTDNAPTIRLDNQSVSLSQSGLVEEIGFSISDDSTGALEVTVSGYPNHKVTMNEGGKSGVIKVWAAYTAARTSITYNPDVTVTNKEDGKSSSTSLAITVADNGSIGEDGKDPEPGIPPTEPEAPKFPVADSGNTGTAPSNFEVYPTHRYSLSLNDMPVEGMECMIPDSWSQNDGDYVDGGRDTSKTGGEIFVAYDQKNTITGYQVKIALPRAVEHTCGIYGGDDTPELVLGTFTPNPSAERATLAEGSSFIYVNWDLSKQLSEKEESLLIAVDADGNVANGIQITPASREVFTKYLDDVNNSSMSAEGFIEIIIPQVANEIINFGKSESQMLDTGHATIITPAITTTGGVGSDFVSANAEAVTNSIGGGYITGELELGTTPVKGLTYRTQSKSGSLTNGTFEYRLGETVTFYLGALEVGSITLEKGKENHTTTINVKDLGATSVEGANAVHFIKQFSKETPGVIDTTVQDKFAELSSSVNALIDMSLPNGQVSESSNTRLYSEMPYNANNVNHFVEQFTEGGKANDLLKELNITPLENMPFTYSPYVMRTNIDHTNIQKEILGLHDDVDGDEASLKNNVDSFHIFHQRGRFALYSPTFSTFANVEQKATPVVMPRTDKNKHIGFGELAAFDVLGRSLPDNSPNATFTDTVNKLYMGADFANKELGEGWGKSSNLVSKENAHFTTPIIATGSIGTGKVMVIGSTEMLQVLAEPNKYEQGKKGLNYIGDNTMDVHKLPDQPGDMFNLMNNSFKWLVERDGVPVTAGSKITVKSNVGALSGGFSVHGDYNVNVKTHNAGDATTDLTGVDVFILQPLVDVMNAEDLSWLDMQIVNIYTGLGKGYEQRLIDFVENGGNLIVMQTLGRPILEPIDVYQTASSADTEVLFTLDAAKILDAAGLASIGTPHGASKRQSLPAGFNDGKAIIDTPIISNRPVYPQGAWMLETYNLAEPFTKVGNNYTWNADSTSEDSTEIAMHGLFIEGVTKIQKDGEAEGTFLTGEEWANRMAATYSVPLCEDTKYDYELGCIEYRPGNNIPVSVSTYGAGAKPTSDMTAKFSKLPINEEVTGAMHEAANMGTALVDLYEHELYYRSRSPEAIDKGIEPTGKRLNIIDLERTYNNLKAWMWNAAEYSYNSGMENTFGHKEVVEFLNAYTGNQYGNGGQAPEGMISQMKSLGMLTDEGLLNPSYPLNYQEKPLTRIMLGRAYYDVTLDHASVKADVSDYPGKSIASGNETVTLTEQDLNANEIISTGLYAKPHETITVSQDFSGSVLIGLHDGLRPKHEKGLTRPAQMGMVIKGGGTFEVPFGGLIFIKPSSVSKGDEVTISGAGVVAAPTFVMTGNSVDGTGSWKNDVKPVGANIDGEYNGSPWFEVITDQAIFTAPTDMAVGLSDSQVLEFAKNMEQFAEQTAEFYGHPDIMTMQGKKLRYAIDRQISIGLAHSGYPVMHAWTPTEGTLARVNPMSNWIWGHEFGHNENGGTPFSKESGVTEVANNLLAMYTNSVERRNGIPNTADRGFNGTPAWTGSGTKLSAYGKLIMNVQVNDIDLPEQYKAELGNAYKEGQFGWNFVKSMNLQKDCGDVRECTIAILGQDLATKALEGTHIPE